MLLNKPYRHICTNSRKLVKVTRLCDLTNDNDTVTSVSWAERGNLVAVGTHRGYVQIWDVMANKKINTLEGHSARYVYQSMFQSIQTK